MSRILSVDDTTKQADDPDEAGKECGKGYRAIFEHSPVAIQLCDAAGMVTTVNPAYLKLFGIGSQQELRGYSLFADPGINDAQKEQLHLKKTVHYERSFDCEKEKAMNLYPGSKNGIIWLDIRITPLGNLEESITGFLVQIQDITGRKATEQALAESEVLFCSYSDSLMDPVLILSSEGRVHFANPAALKFMGIADTGSQGGRSFITYLDGDSQNRAITDLHTIHHLGGPLTTEYCVNPLNGEQRWVEARGIRIDYKGSFANLINLRDITERIRFEEALQESEEKYRLLIENSHDIIYMLSLNGIVTFVSPSWTELLGHPLALVTGKPFRHFIHPEDLSGCLRFFQSVIDTGQRQVGVEYRVQHADGTWRWHTTSAVPLTDKTGTITGFEGTARDITEHKELEQERDAHTQELRQFSGVLAAANKKLSLLSSITRHDINNQLSVLVGYLHILEKKQPDRSMSDLFKKIDAAAQRISAMIRFTREYEQIGVNAPAWQDTRTIVDTAATDAPLGNILVKNDIPAGSEMLADPLIVKVFYNLMDNAVRYGQKITTIRFFAEETAADYRIVCEDDGEGVAAQEKEKIFKRGFGKNTGLGLALSREILDITGITIKETGEPGKGARFEMTVPRGAWRIAGTGEK